MGVKIHLMYYVPEAAADARFYGAVSPYINWRWIMIKITDKAKEKLQGTMERNPGKYFRIILKGIG